MYYYSHTIERLHNFSLPIYLPALRSTYVYRYPSTPLNRRMDVTLRSFQHDRQLARFVITGEPTGKLLGVGSYGSVEEVYIPVYSIFKTSIVYENM